MRITNMSGRSAVHYIDKQDNLDPVVMVLTEFSEGVGQFTVTCYGKSWTAFWGAMGTDLKSFILHASSDYIAGCFAPRLESDIVDFHAVSAAIGVSVDNNVEMAMEHERIIEHYGDEFWHDLPRTGNHEYAYLCRIIETAKKAIQLLGVDDSGKTARG